MRNNKVIDPSLNKKIAENERRIQNLFNTEFIISKSKQNIMAPSQSQRNMKNIPHKKNIRAPSQSQRNIKNIHHTKNKSQDELYKTLYNMDNKDISLFKGTIDNTFQKTLQIGDDGETAFINRMEKRIKSRKKSNHKEEEKNDRIFYSTVNNVYQKMKEKKNKKVLNRDQVDNIVDRLYNNDYKNKKQPNKVNKVNKKTKEIEKDNSAIDFSLKTESMDTYNKKPNEPNNVNVDNMIERFEEDMKKRNEKMERKRKELKNNEKKIYTYKPKINEKKKVEYTGKDDFLERQKKYDEQKKKKEERFKEDLKREEEKKINENNFLLQKNNRKERRERQEKKEKVVKTEKKDENKKDQNKPENKKKKEEVEKMIKHFYDWESKRKEKIASKKKAESGKEETEFDHMPKINKRSNSLANKNNKKKDQPDVFSRLSKEDKMLKEKRQVLIDLCTPTFKPNCFLHNQKIKRLNKESPNKNTKKKIYPYNESSSEEEGEESNEGSEESDVKEDNFDYKQDPNNFIEDDIHDELRKMLLEKVKK